MRYLVYAFFAVMVVLPARCIADADVAEQADRLMEDVVKHRMNIRRGIVRTTIKSSRKDRPERIGNYSWYYDDSRIRADVEKSIPRFWASGEVSDTKSTSKYVFTPERVLTYDDVASPLGKGVMALSSDQRDPVGQKTVKGLLPYRVDLRSLGMIPRQHDLLYLTEPDDFLMNDERTNVIMTPDNTAGNRIMRICFEKGKLLVNLRIDEMRGPSLVFASTEWTRENKPLIDSIRVSVKQYGDIWYPSTLEYERTDNGKTVARSEMTVNSASFNDDAEIEPGMFEFSGLGLPVGHLVREIPSPPGPTRYWDGKQLVAGDPQIDRTPLQATSSATTRFWWIGINLIIVGILIALVALKRR